MGRGIKRARRMFGEIIYTEVVYFIEEKKIWQIIKQNKILFVIIS